MNLGKKYLKITNKENNEHFGLFQIIEKKLNNLENFANTATSHWMFNEKGLRKYDDNAIPLFNNEGIQILDIDTNGNSKPLNGNNDSSINNNKFVKQSYENNQYINQSTIDNSISKIFNNVSNNVVQNNLSDASAAAGALNVMNFNNIHCKNVTISNFSQYANANATIINNATQNAKSNISTNISNNIQKTIHDVASNNFGQYSDENKKASSDVANMFGFGNDTDSGITVALSLGNSGLFSTPNNKLDSTIANTLDLDNSITIKSENNIQNIINNTISQSNIASCAATAAAANVINIDDIACLGDLTVTNGKQTAYANSIANCTFNQKNSVTINNNIKTSISDGFNQVYDELLKTIETKYGKKDSNGNYIPKDAASAKAAYKEYYDSAAKLNALGRLHSDIINTVGCATTDKNNITTTVDSDCIKALQDNTVQSEKNTPLIIPPRKSNIPSDTPPSQPSSPPSPNKDDNNMLIIYILAGVILFMITCIIIYMIFK
jgi:hypothetical protein